SEIGRPDVARAVRRRIDHGRPAALAPASGGALAGNARASGASEGGQQAKPSVHALNEIGAGHFGSRARSFFGGIEGRCVGRAGTVDSGARAAPSLPRWSAQTAAPMRRRKRIRRLWTPWRARRWGK